MRASWQSSPARQKPTGGLVLCNYVIAQDMYDALTGKGYRVFFCRITLEDKPGVAYEPYNFAALNFAKAMRNTISDDEVASAWNAIHERGYMVEYFDFIGISTTYVPAKELSQATSDLRIDISIPPGK